MERFLPFGYGSHSLQNQGMLSVPDLLQQTQRDGWNSLMKNEVAEFQLRRPIESIGRLLFLRTYRQILIQFPTRQLGTTSLGKITVPVRMG